MTLEPERAAHFAEFEAAGEEAVRHALATNQYKIFALKVPHAQEWLRIRQESRDEALSARNESRADEAISIARSASAAAAAAALEAHSANKIARSNRMLTITSIAISIIAIIISIIFK